MHVIVHIYSKIIERKSKLHTQRQNSNMENLVGESKEKGLKKWNI